jgi:hypothetical protein
MAMLDDFLNEATVVKFTVTLANPSSVPNSSFNENAQAPLANDEEKSTAPLPRTGLVGKIHYYLFYWHFQPKMNDS